jgi:cardiolipin synthase
MELTNTVVLTLLIVLAYLVGVLCAVLALWRSRTPQGATAWVVGLISSPFVLLPLFVVFGRSKFQGYVHQRRELDKQARGKLPNAEQLRLLQTTPADKLFAIASLTDASSQPGFTNTNDVELLINAERAYPRMLEAIKTAKHSILFQFYIFREDAIGNEFAKLLMKKASEGVKVYFLCDNIGSRLNSKFIKKLEAHGISVRLFRSWKVWNSQVQVNFRNHRKVLVVDGSVAFVGGINIGDDYLGRCKDIGPWRDTHLRMTGPAALATQVSFTKDWYWVTGEIPDVSWTPHPTPSKGAEVLVLHTGPADEKEICLLAHIGLINTAIRRVWIATPYFVLPEGLANALILASLRGVDVQVLLPSYSDSRLVMYASEVYVEKLLAAGIKFSKYLPGFLHQKVMLVDDDIGVVGSINLDSRSIFINFEIMAIVHDETFALSLADMLEDDFRQSQPVTLESLQKRSLRRQLTCRAANLMAPVL